MDFTTEITEHTEKSSFNHISFQGVRRNTRKYENTKSLKKLKLMLSQKVVTPVKTGVQAICNYLKKLDSADASLRAQLSR